MGHEVENPVRAQEVAEYSTGSEVSVVSEAMGGEAEGSESSKATCKLYALTP